MGSVATALREDLVAAPQATDSHRIERLRAVVRPIIRYQRGRRRGEFDNAAVLAIWREINDAIEDLWAGDCPGVDDG